MRIATIVLGILCVLLICTMTSAQPRRSPPGMRFGFNPLRAMADPDADFENDADEGEPAQDGRTNPIEPGLRPKTQLGRYIATLDFRRDPDAVLRARAKLAADDREALINPPDTHDDGQPAEIEDPAGMSGEQGAAPFARNQFDESANKLLVGTNNEIDLPASVTGREPPQPITAENPSDAGNPATAKRLTKGEQRRADRFRLQVVGGDWAAVHEFLTNSAGEDAAAIYQGVLLQLAGDSAIVPDEIIAIADASPAELSDSQVAALGQLLKAAVHRGADAGHVGSVITNGTRHFGGPEPVGRQRAASLLMSAGLPVEAQPFLDPLDRARKDKNAKLLNLHAMYFQALSIRKTDASAKSEMVKQSWDLCLEVLAIANAPASERAAALRRAISFLDEMPPEQGEAWLRSVVQSSPDLCWALVQRVNQQARMAKAQMRPAEDRIKLLKRVKRIGTAIVENAGTKLPQYRSALDMMSMAIVDELEFTKQMQQMPQRDNEHVQIVPSERLSECLPTAAWLRAGDAGLAARLELMTAGVLGGSGDIQAVIEMVRPLVSVDRARAQKIAGSVIVAWPNYVHAGGGAEDEYGGGGFRRGLARGMYAGYNPYGGGNEGGIPLTRAKQKRNLEQLGQLLSAFKSFGLASAEQAPLITAFSSSHSDAEVFAEDDVRAVFGPLESLPSAVATGLADSMRRRLGTIWRNTQVQQQMNTKRNDKQIAAEVLRGYDLAIMLANRAHAGDERSWRAALLNADLQFDVAEFLYGQKVDLATYSAMRERSFSAYAEAADRYLDELRTGKSQPSGLVYFHWLSSALGASDLGFLTRQDQPDDDQVDRVIASIENLPQALRARHIGLFATEVATALQTIAPELKVRFLTHACRVIGDHPDGAQARKQLEYYTDLKTEVELRLTIDRGGGEGGGTAVGMREPFGAQISIWSTRAVSRESGGFSKYIQNQQYNPMTAQPVDYKDDFEKKLREVLGERFNVVSITFHKPGARPMGTPLEGWEQHPLAYLLLSPKDESVDRIPPIKLDLDFSDSGGIVIFPVTSTVQLIDARSEPPPGARAPMNIEIEQILDARESLQGLAKLEIRAKADGLIPELSQLLDIRAIHDLSITKIEDHGTTILDLDTTGDAVIPKCERAWTLDLTSSTNAPVASFAFPPPQPSIIGGPAAPKMIHKRYDDADIKECASVIPINMIGPKSASLYFWLIGTIGILTMLALAWFFLARKRKVAEHFTPRFTLPPHLTPVNAISTLRRIASVPGLGLAESEQAALAGTITEIEIKYFGPSRLTTPHNGEAVHDLRPMVERWITLAEKRIAR